MEWCQWGSWILLMRPTAEGRRFSCIRHKEGNPQILTTAIQLYNTLHNLRKKSLKFSHSLSYNCLIGGCVNLPLKYSYIHGITAKSKPLPMRSHCQIYSWDIMWSSIFNSAGQKQSQGSCLQAKWTIIPISIHIAFTKKQVRGQWFISRCLSDHFCPRLAEGKRRNEAQKMIKSRGDSCVVLLSTRFILVLLLWLQSSKWKKKSKQCVNSFIDHMVILSSYLVRWSVFDWWLHNKPD